MELPWQAVGVDEDVVPLTVDLADEALTTSKVAGDLPDRGDTITGLHAQGPPHRQLAGAIGTEVTVGANDYGHPV